VKFAPSKFTVVPETELTVPVEYTSTAGNANPIGATTYVELVVLEVGAADALGFRRFSVVNVVVPLVARMRVVIAGCFASVPAVALGGRTEMNEPTVAAADVPTVNVIPFADIETVADETVVVVVVVDPP